MCWKQYPDEGGGVMLRLSVMGVIFATPDPDVFLIHDHDRTVFLAKTMD